MSSNIFYTKKSQLYLCMGVYSAKKLNDINSCLFVRHLMGFLVSSYVFCFCVPYTSSLLKLFEILVWVQVTSLADLFNSIMPHNCHVWYCYFVKCRKTLASDGNFWLLNLVALIRYFLYNKADMPLFYSPRIKNGKSTTLTKTVIEDVNYKEF